MIVFGVGGGKRTDRGAVWAAKCANCQNDVLLHHVTTHASFRLFFVPIFKYDTKHFLICPVCKQGPRLDEARVRQVETAKLLLVRARMNELTEEQYKTELAVQNPASVGLSGGAAEI